MITPEVGLDAADAVLRRIPPEWVVEDGGTLRPSSQAFNDDGDGEPMSGYLGSLLELLQLSPARVLDGHDGYFLARILVGVLVAEGQEVRPAKVDPPEHICDGAHVHVVGPKANKRRRRLARAAEWVDSHAP